MKHTLASIIIALPAFALAVPSADTYHAVTNDWYQGNWTNVYELAQQRLAANTNDIVGAYIMKDYDIMFSGFSEMSNSIQRLIRAGELITLPAYTNMFPILRLGYEDFLEHVIPARDDSFRIQEQQRAIRPGVPMNSERTLKLFWDNGLWTPAL